MFKMTALCYTNERTSAQ